MVQNPDTSLQPQAANGASKSTTESKDEKAAPVRKRLSLACTTCRQRKVKCDGGRPSCRTCAKFNWPCIYQPSNRKRGPRPRALALMDGSMPYSGRSHWPGTHYYTYGIPGQPISPPMAMPPPQLHQLMPPMPGHQYMEAHANGAPVHANPAAHDGVGAYNVDAYSTYGDYISSTGGIRIHPQGPPPPPHSGLPPMHSPPYSHAPQHPSHAAGGPARHRSGSHYQQHQPPPPHCMPVSDGPSVRPPPPLPPPPSSHMQPPAMHRAPSPFAYAHRGAAPEQPGTSHRHAAHMQQLPSGRMHMAGPMASASSARPELEKQNPPGSTAPQHMHASAQSYTSASAHAHDMQLPSTDALRNTPAIYARRETDAASSRSTTASSTGCARRPSQHTSPLQHPKDMLALSSPVPHPAAHLPPASAEQAMTAPIPSSSSFARPSHEHKPDYKPDCAEPVSAQPLPFSDGKSRPRLPPLTEVLGKDYQQIMSPGANARITSQFGVPASHKESHL
ncbi:hypothetical protein LPJ68_001585 [Coemansia sp. RSA 1086]|nr:hypothetical protein LPJ68_001585 [Coemansia sp. RSA 1086]